jgi:hypothetical protein
VIIVGVPPPRAVDVDDEQPRAETRKARRPPSGANAGSFAGPRPTVICLSPCPKRGHGTAAGLPAVVRRGGENEPGILSRGGSRAKRDDGRGGDGHKNDHSPREIHPTIVRNDCQQPLTVPKSPSEALADATPCSPPRAAAAVGAINSEAVGGGRWCRRAARTLRRKQDFPRDRLSQGWGDRSMRRRRGSGSRQCRYAASSYSRSSPPRRSGRRTRSSVSTVDCGAGALASGGRCSSARCGRCVL